MALATMYLDPTPSAEEENDARITSLAWARGLGHGAWAISGDWNRHPSALKADLMGPLSAAVVASTSPTCYSSYGSPTCIDWWILGPDLAARSPSAGTWAEKPCRPTALWKSASLGHADP